MVITVTYEQFLTERAQQSLSPAERVKVLTAGNQRLDGHSWTDDQLRSVPAELIEFAWKNSLALRTEFITYDTLTAYWRQLQRKK